MKKTYVSPLIEEVSVVAESMLANSVRFGEGNISAEESYTKEHRGEWGNLWK